MNPRNAVRLLALFVGSYFLYFDGTDQRGLVGPDEPRYASIARTMAESGDWVTPRLAVDGAEAEPWFEKPALLYWIGAGFNSLDDQATRAPLGLLGLAFLVFFHWRMCREFGEKEADFATAILATSAGWVAFSQVGVFDLPLSVGLAGSLLALLHWVGSPKSRQALYYFGASLGFAVLAKGLVGPAIATLAVLAMVPRLGFAHVIKNLLSWRTLVPFVAVAGPWYVACYWANGAVFVEEFIWKHHILRVVSPEIDHVRPFWFYVPVLALFLAPWSALLIYQPVDAARRDPRVRLLAAWALATFVLFSVSTNKLPGYILPALPPLAALMGIRLARGPIPAALIAACGLTLCALPLAAAVLPDALAQGFFKAWPPENWMTPGLAVIAAAALLAGGLQARGRTVAAVGVIAVAAIVGFVSLKRATFSEIDRLDGSRSIWRLVEGRRSEVCVGEVRRHVLYGLAYYSDATLPSCAEYPRPLEIAGDPPIVEQRKSEPIP